MIMRQQNSGDRLSPQTQYVSIAELLREASQQLSDAGHDSARLEAEVLLAHLLQTTRTRLYITSGEKLSEEQKRDYQGLIERHLRHEPVAYITGNREFYGLDLKVDRRVLIPRPETEHLVEKTLELARPNHQHPWKVADVGTGSGAIAIALATSLPQATIYAIDASHDSLEVAAHNCRAHAVANRVHLLLGHLLSPLPSTVDFILANLPYIPSAQLAHLPPDVANYEPVSALDGGDDGLALYRELLQQAPRWLLPGGHILLEIAADQGQLIIAQAERILPNSKVTLEKDYAGLDRVACIKLSELSD